MDVLLGAVPWTAVGPGSVLALTVIALIRGDLVPRKVHEEIMQSKDKALDVERENSAQLRAALTAALNGTRRESGDAESDRRAH